MQVLKQAPDLEKECSTIIFPVDFQLKIKAEGTVKQFCRNMSAPDLAIVLHQGSEHVLFVIMEFMNQMMSHYAGQTVWEMFNLMKKILLSWYKPENGVFIRNGSREFPKFIRNSLSRTFGSFLKRIHIELEPSSSNYPKLYSFILNLQDSDGIFRVEHKLYIWRCYLQAVADIDHQMPYSQYRELSQSFQKYVIPIMVQEIVSTQMEDLQLNVNVEELVKLQSQMNIKEGESPPDTTNNSSFSILREYTKTEIVISLINYITCFAYNIVYTEYESSQPLFDQCTISFPSEVALSLSSPKFIQGLVSIIRILLQHKRDHIQSPNKELMLCWQSLNKCIMMKTSVLQESCVREYHSTLVKAVCELGSMLVEIVKAYGSGYGLEHVYRLALESFRNCLIGIELASILLLDVKDASVAVGGGSSADEKHAQVFIRTASELTCLAIDNFAVNRQHYTIHNEYMKVWSQINKQVKFIAGNSYWNRQLKQRVNKLVRQIIEKYLIRIAQQASPLFAKESLFAKQPGLAHKNIQAQFQQVNIENIQHACLEVLEYWEDLLLFSGCFNYDIVKEFLRNTLTHTQTPTPLQKICQTNSILFVCHILNNYPHLDTVFGHTYRVSPEQLAHFRAQLNEIVMLSVQYVSMTQCEDWVTRFPTPSLETLIDEQLNTSKLLLIKKLCIEFVTNVALESPSPTPQADIEGWSQQSQTGNYSQSHRWLIGVLIRSEVYRNLNVEDGWGVNQQNCLGDLFSSNKRIIFFNNNHVDTQIPLLRSHSSQQSQLSEKVLLWLYSYILLAIHNYALKPSFWALQNSATSTLQLYDLLYTVSTKYKWAISRKQDFISTHLGLYLIENTKILAHLLLSDSQQQVSKQQHVLGVHRRLFKVITVLLLDQVSDEYVGNSEAIVTILKNQVDKISLKGSTDKNHVQTVRLLGSLIGIFETIDTIEIYSHFLSRLDQSIPLKQLFNEVLLPCNHRPNSYLIKQVMKLQYSILLNKCHRLSSSKNIYTMYELILLFMEHWVLILQADNQAKTDGSTETGRNPWGDLAKGDSSPWGDVIVQIYKAVENIMKCGYINFSLLNKQSQNNWFVNCCLEGLVRNMNLRFSRVKQHVKLSALLRGIFDYLWKVDLVEFILKYGTTQTIANYAELSHKIVQEVKTLISEKCYKGQITAIPLEIEYPLESVCHILGVMRKAQRYEHRAAYRESAKFYLSVFFDDSNSRVPPKISLLVHLFEYLLVFAESEKTEVYITKLISNTILSMDFVLSYEELEQVLRTVGMLEFENRLQVGQLNSHRQSPLVETTNLTLKPLKQLIINQSGNPGSIEGQAETRNSMYESYGTVFTKTEFSILFGGEKMRKNNRCGQLLHYFQEFVESGSHKRNAKLII